MIKGYVRKSERILFGFALAFSLFIYGIIAFGFGAAVLDGSTLEDTTESFDDFGDSDFGSDSNEKEYLEEPPDEQFAYIGTIETETLEMMDELSMDEEFYEYEDYDTDDSATEEVETTQIGLLGVTSIFLFYVALFVFIVFGAHVLAVGHLMGNGVRVSEKQFPELWTIFGRAALDLGIKKLPSFYLVESGGLLNAFATRLFTRSYVAIYADLAERLYEGDEDSVNFVVAHELVHVKRNHMLRNLITLPAEMIPFLKPAWRRACEYSCDAGAAMLAPVGAEKGLVLLAAGKKLSARMDVAAYVESFRAERSVWKHIAELAAGHPHLPKRILALRKRLPLEGAEMTSKLS